MSDFLYIACNGYSSRKVWGEGTQNTGLHGYSFDQETGAARYLGQYDETLRAGDLCVDSTRRILYVADRIADNPWHKAQGVTQATGGGNVFAYRADDQGALSLLNHQYSFGLLPHSLALDKSRRYVLVSNYGDEGAPANTLVKSNRGWEMRRVFSTTATVCIRLEDNGALGSTVGIIEHTSISQTENEAKQFYAHPSCLGASPLNIFATAANPVSSDSSSNSGDSAGGAAANGTNISGDDVSNPDTPNKTEGSGAAAELTGSQHPGDPESLNSNGGTKNDSLEAPALASDMLFLTCDRSCDCFYWFKLEASSGKLIRLGEPVLQEIATGPLHFAWHPSQQLLYCVNARQPTLDTYSYDDAGGMSRVASINNLDVDMTDRSVSFTQGKLLLSPDAQHLYSLGSVAHVSGAVSERNGYLNGYRIATDGSLKLEQSLQLSACDPQDLALSPNGRWLAITSPYDNLVVIVLLGSDGAAVEYAQHELQGAYRAAFLGEPAPASATPAAATPPASTPTGESS